jgi:hypothetical protein
LLHLSRGAASPRLTAVCFGRRTASTPRLVTKPFNKTRQIADESHHSFIFFLDVLSQFSGEVDNDHE